MAAGDAVRAGKGGRERASERGREGEQGRAPLSAHTLLIDFARVHTSCRNTLRVIGIQQFSLKHRLLGCWRCHFLILREGRGSIKQALQSQWRAKFCFIYTHTHNRNRKIPYSFP